MKRFALLFESLDRTNKTNEKVAALTEYFQSVPAADAAWAMYMLSGRKLKRLVPSGLLRQWARETAGIETWLMDECYEAVGDLAETISLILPDPTSTRYEVTLKSLVEDELLPLGACAADEQRTRITDLWSRMTRAERLVVNKLITGSFRVGVSQKLIVRALADAFHLNQDVVSHRMMGDWQPTAEFMQELARQDTDDAQHSRPYPFFLAQALEQLPEELGDVNAWQAEWKWDGIRAQVIRRDGDIFIWSRGEELMTDRFPEIVNAASAFPDGTVLDGEIIAMRYGAILPFSEMQRRIGRKNLTKKILEEVPVRFFAFDLLEFNATDIRSRKLSERRSQLEGLMSAVQSLALESAIQLPPVVSAHDWNDLAVRRERCREVRAEGLMLKHRDSPYRIGRPRGEWWKWKIEPYTVDAVLIYAQQGHGRRAGLYTDYTFAVWDQDRLLPFAKAYSGLTDEEIRQVDRFVREHTLERFGPVRSVTPELVFELAFENIQASSRHKSGIAVRFPRILRWRQDKQPAEADSLDTIRHMLSGPKQS